MQQIINFLIRYKNLLLYLLLITVALISTIQSHSYHHSKFFNSSNWISGNTYQFYDNILSYFKLGEENKKLLEENTRLRVLLFNVKKIDVVEIDTVSINYKVIPARIIKNSYSSPRNYITINIGKKKGAKQDMGVITASGILGIIENSSTNFSRVQSILNTKSIISAKIKNTEYFGSLTWDTKEYNLVQLIDVPRIVHLKTGDTIVTSAMSSIFPGNIPIGIIKKFNLNTSKRYYTIDITLFNDMANIKNVYVINSLDKKEIQQLEIGTDNVE